MAERTVTIKCGQCGRMLKVKQPEAPGVYKVTCPKCQRPIQLRLQAKPLRIEGSQESAGHTEAKKQKVPMLTDIVAWKNGSYAVRPAVPVNTPYAFKCPKCGKMVLFKLPKTGVLGVKCRHCSSLSFVKGVNKKETKPSTKAQPKDDGVTNRVGKNKHPSPGVLSWGNIFNRKQFVLPEGTTVIGRKDSKRPSDIEFKDSEMSRQSVAIEVTLREKEYFFKLTVKNALNDVLHNNKPIMVSESVYLNYDDSIKLGNTVINFKEKKK